MGFQARKSFKLAPGVRMTVSPRGVSTSAGVKGARVTRGAGGRVTRTRPGLMAPKWEKALLTKPEPATLEGIGREHEEARLHGATCGNSLPQQ